MTFQLTTQRPIEQRKESTNKCKNWHFELCNEKANPGNAKYLALSFAPLKLSDDGQTQSVSGLPIETTIKEIEKVGKPFEIPAGKYFLTLKVLNDIPVLDMASNEYRYLNAMAHGKRGGQTTHRDPCCSERQGWYWRLQKVQSHWNRELATRPWQNRGEARKLAL